MRHHNLNGRDIGTPTGRGRFAPTNKASPSIDLWHIAEQTSTIAVQTCG